MKVATLRDMWRNRKNRDAIYCKSEFWDAKAMEYQGDAVSMWPNNNLNPYYHREQIRVIESLLPDVKGLNVLDIGCGTGRNSRYLTARGAKVLGFDFSSKVIEIARQKSTGDNPSFRVQSIYDLDDVGAYDVAVSWGTVTVACRNRTELKDALIRIAKSLKPGGKILLCEPIHKGFLHRVLNMNVREFSDVLRESGFRVEKIRHLHFWPVRLALAYFRWPWLLTAGGYYLGAGIMSLSGNRSFGDYKVIYASLAQ